MPNIQLFAIANIQFFIIICLLLKKNPRENIMGSNDNVIDVDDNCNISINGNDIIINGVKQTKTKGNNLIVKGNIEKLETDKSVSVYGKVGSIHAKGSVNCDNIYNKL